MTNLNVQIPNSLYKQIEARKARGSLDKFKQVLSKVPDVEPEDYDKLVD
ncbi:hypothetical protein RIVM261_027950 [Rivularia sp. IAM M-261]|nr:hypothetical protein RIVM261_027950 [Rivularia sp. IAM M-261]